ncbi:MAG TPA: hypothetical protein VEK57_16450 [Thermoanaerobaculia bacterium]|nr:hypothetical protein [Thermoanaerobaculia bacterium]
MADSYYGFSLSASGTTNGSAYYYISITQNSGEYDGAAITLYPTSSSPSYFNYRSTSVQWQAPPARISGGLTVVTGGNNIIGVLGASPALNVSLTVICYGAGNTFGSVTLPAGETEVPFNFSVNSSESLEAGGGDFLAKNAPKPEAE